MPFGIPEMGIGVLLLFRGVMDSKSVLIYLFLYVLCVCRSISSGKCRLIKSLKEHSFTPNRRASDLRLSSVDSYNRRASPYRSMLRREMRRPFGARIIPWRA